MAALVVLAGALAVSPVPAVAAPVSSPAVSAPAVSAPVVSAPGVSPVPGAVAAADRPAVRFGDPGPPQAYVVPIGVRVVRITARGAGGGGGNGGSGGDGARVVSLVAVQPGQVLRVDVGAGGVAGASGAGGAASSVTGLGVLVVAGGGGGAGRADPGQDAGPREAVADPADLGTPAGQGRAGDRSGGRPGRSFVHDGHDGLPGGVVRRLAHRGPTSGAGAGGRGGDTPEAGRAGEVVIRPLDRRPVLDRPVVWRVEPRAGPTGGGTEVTVRGRGLHRVEQVRVGGRPATDLIVISDRQVRVISPSHRAGRVDVTVRAAGATATARDSYTYRRASGQARRPIDRPPAGRP